MAEIKTAIEQLSFEERAELAAWLHGWEDDEWGVRRDGVWTKPTSLGDKINSVGWDFSPKISPDGKWFFFTSNRGFAEKSLEKRLSYKELLQKLHSPGNGLRDIYKIGISALNLAK